MPTHPSSTLKRTVSSPFWTMWAFAFGCLVLGSLPPALLFSLSPMTAARIGLGPVPIPAWLFTGVWFVIYPAMGVATWLVWRRRGEVDVSIPLVIFAVAFLQSLSFWLTNSIYMTAVIDALGVLLAYTVAYVYLRYDRRAVWLLLPWLVWMPVTLGIKLWMLAPSR